MVSRSSNGGRAPSKGAFAGTGVLGGRPKEFCLELREADRERARRREIAASNQEEEARTYAAGRRDRKKEWRRNQRNAEDQRDLIASNRRNDRDDIARSDAAARAAGNDVAVPVSLTEAERQRGAIALLTAERLLRTNVAVPVLLTDGGWRRAIELLSAERVRREDAAEAEFSRFIQSEER
jgi:hypothetical protein